MPLVRSGFEPSASSRALPNASWLAPATVADALGGGTGTTPAATNPTGRHGHALISTTIAGVVLAPGGASNKVTRAAPLTIVAKFANQGDSDERNVVVTASLAPPSGKAVTASHKVLITKKGLETTVSIPLASPPPAGTVAQLTVKVTPVPGEKTVDNNQSSYTILLSGP